MEEATKEYALVTSKFHPDTTSATGQYMTDIATHLRERGLDVTVYTRTQSGVGDESPDEELNVPVTRLPLPNLQPQTVFHRGLNWILFTVAVSALFLFKPRQERSREVIFVSYPTILPPVMYFVCRIRGWDYTYIVHDLHPDGVVELGYVERGGPIHRCWQRINRGLLSEARAVIALGPAMRDRIIDGAGSDFDERKVNIIHNWADGEFITPRAKNDNWFSAKHGTDDSFTLVYSGNIGEFHDLETLVEAAVDLQSADVKILIIGEGDNKENIRELAAAKGVLGDTVEILPYQPWKDVPYSLTAGDVSVVSIKEGFEGISVSSKLYTALATGQPMLLIAQPTSDEARVIDSFDVGKRVSQGDTDRLVECVSEWMDNPSEVERQGRKARETFENNFTEQEALQQYYRTVVDGPFTEQEGA